MKVSHAAALALVGWYLAAPPIMSDPEPTGPHNGPESAALMAPLGFWFKYGEFDSAAECKDEELYRWRMGAREFAKKPTSAEDRAVAFRNAQVQCIASDDPRLKEK
jgi:hypothetical protein